MCYVRLITEVMGKSALHFLQTHDSTTNIPVIWTFLLQDLVIVSSIALVMFLFAAADVTIAQDRCSSLFLCVAGSGSCTVNKASDCQDGETYINTPIVVDGMLDTCKCCPESCCGSCVTYVGT